MRLKPEHVQDMCLAAADHREVRPLAASIQLGFLVPFVLRRCCPPKGGERLIARVALISHQTFIMMVSTPKAMNTRVIAG
jgi:hypothetical protein